MKKLLFALVVSTFIISTAVLADEKIKLAQVIGQGGASTSTTVTSSSITAGGTAAGATATYVAIGAFVAIGIGVAAGANPSTSH